MLFCFLNKEDISNLALDVNDKGITKSPLYSISHKAENYDLQKDKPTDEDFKSAVGSFKSWLQDRNVGILDKKGKIKQELISGNQDLIIDDNFSNDGASSAEYTAGRKTVFVLSGGSTVAAIILAIEALTIACIIAASSAVTLFLLGCFYNLLKEAVNSCLPGGGSENSFDNNLEKGNDKAVFISKYGKRKNDDPYNNPEIDNGNQFY